MNNTPTKKPKKSDKKPLNNGKQMVRDKNGKFVKGHPCISEGRPVGSKNFATDFDEAVEKLAKLNKISISEARMMLIRKAYTEAKLGNFPFYKDIMDRYYGKATESMEITGKEGEPIKLDVRITEALNKIYGES